ncbi:MAG: histidine phosphatase family protein [Spirochaetales bacterium]|nr:histidine phosphatase family protein [Spirochaetales bacterium]
MRKIVFIRHAEPVPANGDLHDFDRTLVKAGEKQGEEAARILKNKKTFPDIVISSPAVRALQTAEIIGMDMGFPTKEIIRNEGLYSQMSGKELLDYITALDNSCSVLFIVGHEPSLSLYSAYFLPDFEQGIPKAGIVAIKFDVNNWQDIEPLKGELIFFEYPEKKFQENYKLH